MNYSNLKLVKTNTEIETMREGGRIMAEMMHEIRLLIKPGVTTWNLEEKFISLCKQNSVLPSCKGYAPHFMPPYPTGLCVSVNNQCVHCFPKKTQVLKDGDVLTVDTVIKYKGFHLDSAFCTGVGIENDRQQKLLNITKGAFDAAIKKVVSGNRVGNISNTIQNFVESKGYNVLREYSGHGIGEEMHEPPEIPCWGDIDEGMVLEEGMTICVESLVCEGKPIVENTSSWETRMKDRKFFAQYEHTVLVTKDGYELLTSL